MIELSANLKLSTHARARFVERVCGYIADDVILRRIAQCRPRIKADEKHGEYIAVDCGEFEAVVIDSTVVTIVLPHDLFCDINFWQRIRNGQWRSFSLRVRSRGRAFGGFPLPRRADPLVADDIVLLQRIAQAERNEAGEPIVYQRTWCGHNYAGAVWLVAFFVERQE